MALKSADGLYSSLQDVGAISPLSAVDWIRQVSRGEKKLADALYCICL